MFNSYVNSLSNNNMKPPRGMPPVSSSAKTQGATSSRSEQNFSRDNTLFTNPSQ